MPKFIDATTREQVLELRASGDSYTAIESKLGIPLSDVIKIIKEMYPSPTSETSDDCNPSRPELKPLHKRQAARNLRTAGWIYQRIADHLGISYGSAQRYTCDIKVSHSSPFYSNPERVSKTQYADG